MNDNCLKNRQIDRSCLNVEQSGISRASQRTRTTTIMEAQDTPHRLPNGRFPPGNGRNDGAPKPPRQRATPLNASAAEIAEMIGVDRTIEVLPEHVLADSVPMQQALAHLDNVGMEKLCEAVSRGLTHPEVCRMFGVASHQLYRWLDMDPVRARGFAAAAKYSAEAWMDRGLQRVEEADDALSMAKAREVIAHCRKMAAIRDSKYSDRVQVDATVEHKDDPDSINARLSALLALAKPAQDPAPDPG